MSGTGYHDSKPNGAEGQFDMNTSGLVERLIEFTPILRGSDAKSSRRLKNRISFYKWALVLVDLIAIAAACSALNYIGGVNDYNIENWNQLVTLVVFSFIILSFFPTYHVYNYHRIFMAKTHLALILKSFLWASVCLFMIIFVYKYPNIFRGKYILIMFFVAGFGLAIMSRFFSDQLMNVVKALGIGFVSLGFLGITNYGESIKILEKWYTLPWLFTSALVVIVLARFVLVHIVLRRWVKTHFRKQSVIIGSDEEAGAITEHIIRHDAPYWIQGFISVEGGGSFQVPACKENLCELKDLPTIVAAHNINEIIITDEKIEKQKLISLLDYCTSEGLTVWFSPKVMPIIEMKLYIDDFCGIPMIRLCSPKNTWLSSKIKHGLDALLTLPVLLVLAPVFVIIGVLIKYNSPGPVFYRARAVGRNGKEFTMYKFRSMRVENDNNIHKDFVTKLIKGEIKKEDTKDGVLKVTDDPRVTSVGRVLRKMSMDELPQFINVIKGEMSLVGPRPCLPYEYEIYRDWHKKRLSIRPGITCLWQVAGRSDVKFEDMVILDLYYLYNRNLVMDLNILYETFFAVLGRRGAH